MTIKMIWTGNRIRTFGVFKIREELKKNHSLTSLDLSGYYLW